MFLPELSQWESDIFVHPWFRTLKKLVHPFFAHFSCWYEINANANAKSREELTFLMYFFHLHFSEESQYQVTTYNFKAKLSLLSLNPKHFTFGSPKSCVGCCYLSHVSLYFIIHTWVLKSKFHPNTSLTSYNPRKHDKDYIRNNYSNIKIRESDHNLRTRKRDLSRLIPLPILPLWVWICSFEIEVVPTIHGKYWLVVFFFFLFLKLNRDVLLCVALLVSAEEIFCLGISESTTSNQVNYYKSNQCQH